MKKCPSCGHERHDAEMKCPECGGFYSKIAELIAAEEADEELHSFRGQCRRIFNADDVKHELRVELERMKAGLTKKGMFTLFVIIAFIFALTLSVL